MSKMTPNPLRELARLVRERFDAPRFCRDDGEEIEVENVERFDERTGDRKDRWVWHCPDVRVSFDGGLVTWSQSGADAVHKHGFGRPRWHKENGCICDECAERGRDCENTAESGEDQCVWCKDGIHVDAWRDANREVQVW